MERRTLFVDVLLPLHLPDTYTYRVPFDYNDVIQVGQRVAVQFGAKRIYSALVRRVHDKVPSYTTKYILSILDINPIMGEPQFALWEWMASYYMCYPGDVMAVALPSSLRLNSETTITLNPDFDGDCSLLNEYEMALVNYLSRNANVALNQVNEIVGVQKYMPIVKTMVEKGIVIVEEELKQRYRPKSTHYLLLNPAYQDEKEMRELFDRLEKKHTTHKQLSVLMKFMQLSHFGKDAIRKKQLTSCKELSASAIETLVRNEVLLEEERTESRLSLTGDEVVSADSIVLNEEQQQAFNRLCLKDDPSEGPAVWLLHGVTSSGKTEVYIKLMDEVVRRGGQVLFLLPEIALTAQIICRLRRYFGDKVGVYHSRFSSNERAEIWARTFTREESQYQVLVGARSALFLPFHNLQLVIVDEEHDPSYKQADPAPRYYGRDSAIMLAHQWHARTLLGSATPSLESYFNAKQGKYGLVEMKHRYGGLKMPEVLCSDMKEAYRKKEVQQNISKMLCDAIKEALDNHEQVILFQNRRGFSLHLECEMCHHIPHCQHCDVALVYHKATNSLRCHYCGYSIPVPTECPECHSTNMKMKGFGTERIEDDLSILFPDARIARMDLDATMQKNRYIEIINDFEEQNIDILVGTQMVTKGLDFNNVSVVGILSADNLISYPDFRAYERAFQLMTQVSGRAGRHGHQGKVIIQTFNPWYQAIRDAMDNDYLSMYEGQIVDRRVFCYPPFFKLIEITLRHRESDILDEAAAFYADTLRSFLGKRVIGPDYPSVSRIRGLFIKKIRVRFERSESLGQAKGWMLQKADDLLKDKRFRSAMISFDVDPS